MNHSVALDNTEENRGYYLWELCLACVLVVLAVAAFLVYLIRPDIRELEWTKSTSVVKAGESLGLVALGWLLGRRVRRAERDPKSIGTSKTVWEWEYLLAYGMTVTMVVLMALATVFLFVQSTPTETEWTRTSNIVNGAESLAKVAVGWLFGKQMHRAEVQSHRAIGKILAGGIRDIAKASESGDKNQVQDQINRVKKLAEDVYPNE